jgi:hypothetical protein
MSANTPLPVIEQALKLQIQQLQQAIHERAVPDAIMGPVCKEIQKILRSVCLPFSSTTWLVSVGQGLSVLVPSQGSPPCFLPLPGHYEIQTHPPPACVEVHSST